MDLKKYYEFKIAYRKAPHASAYAGVNCQFDVRGISSASCFKTHVSTLFIGIILSACYFEVISNGINLHAAWIIFLKLLR